MKKFLGLSLTFVFVCLCVAGCGKSESKYEKTMQEYAKKYYELHMSGTEGQTEFRVSIEGLKKAIEIVGDTYDMSKLSDCDDKSYVDIFVKEGTKEIDHYEFHMTCGKK